MNEWVVSVVGGLIAGAITGTIFYVFGARGLEKEASRLRRLATLIIRGVEEGGIAKFNRDKDGNPIGLVISLSGDETPHVSGKAVAVVDSKGDLATVDPRGEEEKE